MKKVKIARWTYRIFFVIGMLAALALGVVPQVYGWFDSPAPLPYEGLVKDIFAGMREVMRTMLIVYTVIICAAVAAGAALIAFAAAWVAREPWHIRLWCGLPMAVAATGYGILILVNG